MVSMTTVIIFSVIGGVVSLSFAAILLSSKKTADLLAEYATPFAAGALLATAFLELIPEGIEQSSADAMLSWALVGLLTFFILESVLGWFHHHHEHPKKDRKQTTSLIVIGDILHNFIDGAAIAAAFLIDTPTGIITTLAVATHEIPQEIGDFGLMLNRGMARLNVLIVNIFSAMATIVGAIIFFEVGRNTQGSLAWLPGLTAGFFIYIAASDIIPDIHRSRSKSKLAVQTFLVLLGVVVVAIATDLTHSLINSDAASTLFSH